jgi:hypothetical protein
MKSQINEAEVDVLVMAICQSANNTTVKPVRQNLLMIATMCANEISVAERKEFLLKKIYSTADDQSLKRSLALVTGIPLYDENQKSCIVGSAKDCLDKIKEIECMNTKTLLKVFKTA